MAKISKTLNVSQPGILSDKLMMLLLILLAVFMFSRPAIAEMSIYIFDPNQSDVVKTGGFAGVHITYAVTGQFRLTVDSDAGLASFEMVDANLTDDTSSKYGRSLDEIFNMTGLAGTVVDGKTVEFEGKTADGTESDVLLKLSFGKGPAHITGKTTPPPNSADMFFYEIDAIGIRKYAGGTGEPNGPYQIATADDLMLLGETPEDYDKHFILTDDIDLNPNLPDRRVFDKAVIAPDTDPNDDLSEFQGTPFSGVFYGGGHMISHLTITGRSYLGLFGQLSRAEIRNIGVVNVEITGLSDIGSLVGFNYRGNIATSFSTGTVSGDGDVGGLVGSNVFGFVTHCCSTCSVSGSGWNVGGLVGSNIKAAPSGETSGESIVASYSGGSVSGTGAVGGLVGWNAGRIDSSYSMGRVSGTYDVGGLVGSYEGGTRYNVGDADSSFWDIRTSGQAESAGGTGKTTAEMQTATTFLDAGWDFVDETDNGTEEIWSICEGTNYPRFVWQIPLGDFVCPDGVTIEDFAFFMEHWLDNDCDSSNDYCEGTDLDQSGAVDAYDLEIFFELWSAEN